MINPDELYELPSIKKVFDEHQLPSGEENPLYRANYQEVHTEIMMVLNALLQYLQREYASRLDRVILFGSVARGEATAASDIDILIVLQDPVNASIEIDRTSEFIAKLCLDHNVLISRQFKSKWRYEEENSPNKKNIRQEGKLLIVVSDANPNSRSSRLEGVSRSLSLFHVAPL